MIPKIELRLGNWVINKEGNFCKIMNGASIDDADSFSAIELNQAILKKCGFSFHDYFKTWQKKQVLPKMGYLLEMDQDYNVKDFGQRYIGVRLTALHQLQNLLFQLKGVEIDFEVAEKNG
ncbi:hypothetical protein [Pollutibacter soli]|uniref:hypothetical protein n=1 Tax=Pollutibacter soli TaxID=3034157 RepID=UPI003013AA30